MSTVVPLAQGSANVFQTRKRLKNEAKRKPRFSLCESEQAKDGLVQTSYRVAAYIGLGSNLDNPIEQLRAGLKVLAVLPDTTLDRCSAFYQTAPVGRLDQPDFINAVCRLQTALTAVELLDHLLAIEAEHGRRRVETGGPRTLDLDLLLYDALTCRTPGLTLPHPRLHERAFVLYPLYELAPDLVIPGRGALAQLLSACVGQKIEKLTLTQ